ncbi:hypothetical protein HPB50_020785 [Hyalomma asiaticum]|uniref:Uncharacterized protein n=1 Tax=Hyalomma asiaticum TaxID=266040 RepID=A0ACB7TKW7_HYAAI|nr:hypothetical protein HPB50_020785 [Hyalomma asiaticum]
MDICPYPNKKICRGRGARSTPVDHNCDPKCSLCGGPHLTAGKSCAARCKTPYVIRKRIGERRAISQAICQQASSSTLNNRSRSRSRDPAKGKRSRSRTPSRSRQHRSRCQSASASRSKSTNNPQEVRNLKQSQTPIATLATQDVPAPSQEARSTPAAKKKALQEEASGQVCSGVDMLILLQATMSTF